MKGIHNSRNDITQELIKSLFDYKDGILYWKVKRSLNVKIGMIAGYVWSNKYNRRHLIKINKYQYQRSRIVFLWHEGWLPEVIDHENRNSLDDRIENLRAASKSQNSINRKKTQNRTSKYIGVSFSKRDNIWRSSIMDNRKYMHIGNFKSEQEAALAYNREAVRYHKEFANLNIIN